MASPTSAASPVNEQGWARLTSRPLYDGRVKLVEHTATVPTGQTVTYEVDHSIPYAVAVLVQLPSGELVLTRQYRFPLDRWIYDLPGGAGSADETPIEAARRECEEETGLIPGTLTPLHTFYSNPGRSAWPTHVFFCDEVSCGAPDFTDPSEAVRTAFVPLREFDSLLDAGQILDPALLIARLLAERKGLLRLP